jgi:hypothetical protein
MFHAPMRRFQLELFICITYFYTVDPFISYVFFPVGLSSLTGFNMSCRVLEFLLTPGGKIGNKNTILVFRALVGFSYLRKWRNDSIKSP